MKTAGHILSLFSFLSCFFLLQGCATDARTSALVARQDRMDTRTTARQERWKIRGDREDARAQARFDSW